ncbi:MAG TPA: OB-fold domain-containing protein [Amycolatopsis sp.]|nr:OB-fold domain-containing protein [Amycolatopsis sp.]
MTDTRSLPPQPVPDPDTAPFWQATGAGRLALCRCQSCRVWLHPPLERCRVCAGSTAFEEVAGTGVLYSFIVQHRPTVPGYLENTPYVVGLVELDEQPGLRLPARIVGVDPADVACGMAVRAELVALPGGDFTVPVFRPLSGS